MRGSKKAPAMAAKVMQSRMQRRFLKDIALFSNYATELGRQATFIEKQSHAT